MAAYARMQHRERTRAGPVLRAAWMRGDGMVHAQPALLRAPRLVRALLYVAVLAGLFLCGYLAWVVHSLVGMTEAAAAIDEAPRRLELSVDSLLISSVSLHGGDLFSVAGLDASLPERFPSGVKQYVPFFPYKKIEVPTSPGAPADAGKEVIPLDFLFIYNDYDASDAYLDEVRKVLREPDMTPTHTDILIRVNDAQMEAPIKDGIVALALRLPHDYPVPLQLAAIPQVVRCLIHNLARHFALRQLPEEELLTSFAGIRLAYEKRGADELYFYAAVGSPVEVSKLPSEQLVLTDAHKAYHARYVKPIIDHYAPCYKSAGPTEEEEEEEVVVVQPDE